MGAQNKLNATELRFKDTEGLERIYRACDCHWAGEVVGGTVQSSTGDLGIRKARNLNFRSQETA